MPPKRAWKSSRDLPGTSTFAVATTLDPPSPSPELKFLMKRDEQAIATYPHDQQEDVIACLNREVPLAPWEPSNDDNDILRPRSQPKQRKSPRKEKGYRKARPYDAELSHQSARHKRKTRSLDVSPSDEHNSKRKGKFSTNSRYFDEGDNASKSGTTNRKAEEESRDSSDEITNSRAKSLKTEPNSPPSSRKFALRPSPHGWSARIRGVSQSGQSASQDLSDPEMALWVPYSEAEEREKPLVPLFVSLGCEELAAIQDASHTTPKIVLEAKANGCTMLKEVEIRWYRDDVEREIDEDGIEHPYVVMREEWKSGKKDRQGDNGKDDDDGGSMAPNELERNDDVPHLPTASETAQPRIPVLQLHHPHGPQLITHWG